MSHAFVNVVVPFDDGKSDAVNAQLDALGNLARPPIGDRLDATEFVHFMSLSVVRGSSREAAHLVLTASADGYPAGVLRRLAREIGGTLRDVLAKAGVPVSESELGEFLVRHDRQGGQGWFSVPGVAFDGTPGMTVGRIRQEARLTSRIQGMLDGLPAGQGPALTTLKRVRAELFGEGVYKWAFVAAPVPLLADTPNGWTFVRPMAWSALRTFLWPLAVPPALALALVWRGDWPLAVFPALALVWRGVWAAILTVGVELLFTIIAAGGAYLWLRHKESTDASDETDPSAQAVREIMARESQGNCVQNHLAAVST